jgi:HD-like signal output (HDOD) protein
MNSNIDILNQIEQIESLPTLPVIVQKIQQLISSDRSNMNQIAILISKDQAISAKVIRLVNSAFFGLRNRVASIQQAIVLLGLNTVTNIVLGISVIKLFSDSKSNSLFNREAFWLHTFGTALGAKLIAIELKLEEPEDYFLAGLLHDIGILVIDQFFHDMFVDVLNIIDKDKVDLKSAELKVFNISHQEVGDVIAQKWKLPSIITHSIRYHLDPFTAPINTPQRTNDICMIIHMADINATNKGISCGINVINKPIESRVSNLIKISEEQIDTIFSSVMSEVHGLMKEWGI